MASDPRPAPLTTPAALEPAAARGSTRAAAALAPVVRALGQAGVRLALEFADGAVLSTSAVPVRARVIFREKRLGRALHRGDHLTLAEAFLRGAIDIDGDPFEVAKLTDVLDMEPGRLTRALWALRLRLPGRTGYNARSVAFHYDRPPEFFLPWLDRWRSYSHGFYATPDDDPSTAQARKMQHAIDCLGLRPGMRVFDMGGGWGCFVEYAGRQGIRVDTITISRAQHRFLSDLIARLRLPCRVELVDLFDYRPVGPFDGAVFMGTLEHVPDYERVVAFLTKHLRPDARVYADFCAQHAVFQMSRFLKKHLWPGPASYVDLAGVVRALTRAGWNVHEVADDTLHYVYTVRDWAQSLARQRQDLAARFGEPTVRAFLMFLWASFHFLTTNRSQAYHVVAGRRPRVV